MKKNQSNLYPFALKDQLSSGLTGQTPSVYIRKDLGSFAAATNSATEFNAQISPGLYDIVFTAAECNCDVLTIQVTLPDGQEPAILDVVEMEGASSSLTAAEVWQYNGTGGRTVTNTIPTAAQNATAVWGAQTKEITGTVTIDSAQVATLATAAALATVGDNVSAVKVKTDNLPATPAATGDAMTLTSAYDAAKTASQFNASRDAVTIGEASEAAIRYGLSTFNPETDAVTIDSEQASTFATAQALSMQEANIAYITASILHWAATASTLTLYDNNGAAIGVYDLTRDSSGNITAIEQHTEG